MIGIANAPPEMFSAHLLPRYSISLWGAFDPGGVRVGAVAHFKPPSAPFYFSDYCYWQNYWMSQFLMLKWNQEIMLEKNTYNLRIIWGGNENKFKNNSLSGWGALTTLKPWNWGGVAAPPEPFLGAMIPVPRTTAPIGPLERAHWATLSKVIRNLCQKNDVKANPSGSKIPVLT